MPKLDRRIDRHLPRRLPRRFGQSADSETPVAQPEVSLNGPEEVSTTDPQTHTATTTPNGHPEGDYRWYKAGVLIEEGPEP